MTTYTLGELLAERKRKKASPIPECELQEMIDRCRTATPGSWTVALERDGFTIGGPVCRMDENNRMVVGTAGDWGPTADPEHDAEFIAHSRSDLPRLLIEVMRLRGLGAPDLDDLEFGG
ncbi:MAG: hypothetical protein ACK5Q5_08610 [Planctomycetaceae bacterium]